MMGHVSLVGAGPGDPALLTRKAVMRLRARGSGPVRRARRRARASSGPPRAAVLRRKACRTACAVSDRDSRGDDSGREAWPASRAAEGRRSLRVRPRRRRGARARRGGRAVRHRARHQQRRGCAGSRRYSGDASRPRVGLSGRQRPRRGRLRRVDRPAARRTASRWSCSWASDAAPPLASRLIDRGWSRETPAAIVADASLPQQQVWRGTLDDLASDRARLEGDGPATIVIGAVAALALITDACTSGDGGEGAQALVTRIRICLQATTPARTAARASRSPAWPTSTNSSRRSSATSAAS